MANNTPFFKPFEYLLLLKLLINKHNDEDILKGTAIDPDGLITNSQSRKINLRKEYNDIWQEVTKYVTK